MERRTKLNSSAGPASQITGCPLMTETATRAAVSTGTKRHPLGPPRRGATPAGGARSERSATRGSRSPRVRAVNAVSRRYFAEGARRLTFLSESAHALVRLANLLRPVVQRRWAVRVALLVAVLAWRCAQLLNEVSVTGIKPQRHGANGIVEVYPGAA